MTYVRLLTFRGSRSRNLEIGNVGGVAAPPCQSVHQRAQDDIGRAEEGTAEQREGWRKTNCRVAATCGGDVCRSRAGVYLVLSRMPKAATCHAHAPASFYRCFCPVRTPCSVSRPAGTGRLHMHTAAHIIRRTAASVAADTEHKKEALPMPGSERSAGLESPNFPSGTALRCAALHCTALHVHHASVSMLL